MLASPEFGGLGFPSCVAGVMANRARELLISFDGPELQAQVRRAAWDELRAAGSQERPQSALRESVDLLAARGFYVRDNQELFQSRVVAALAKQLPCYASDGLWRPTAASLTARVRFSSVGALFAAVRAGFRRGPSAWQATSPFWWEALPEWARSRLRCSTEDVASAVAEALAEARADRSAELVLFGVRDAHRDGQQVWVLENWRGNDPSSCPRTRALTKPNRLPAVFTCAGSGGGASGERSSCAYVFSALLLPADADRDVAALPQPDLHIFARRMPESVGTRVCGVHDAELAGLLGCVAKAPTGCGVVIAVGREALIDLVDGLHARSRRDWQRTDFQSWERRLRVLLLEREEALPQGHRTPSIPIPAELQPWRTSTAFKATQLVWTPSHQPLDDNRVPCTLCASLNHLADEDVARTRQHDAPVPIKRPAGGHRVHLEHNGRTVIGDPAAYIRGCLVAEASLHLASLQTQGFVAQQPDKIWGFELEQRRSVDVPDRLCHLATELQPSWRRGDVLDMHTHVFGMQHGLGGSYTSLAKRRDEYKRIADAICDDLDPDGTCCLLCGWETGSRWHALLRCPLVEVGLGDIASSLRHSMFAYAEAALGAADIPLEDVPLESGETIRAYRRPRRRTCEDATLEDQYPKRAT